MYSIVKKQKTGFSLVETLVAISILLISIAAPLTIASRSLQNNFFSGEQLTAIMLAQEGIEAVTNTQRRSLRVYIADPLNEDAWDWYSSLPSNCRGTSASPANGCPIDVRGETNTVPVIEGNNDCSTYTPGSNICRLWFDEDHPRAPYSHDNNGFDNTGAEATPFSRAIRVNDVGGGTEQVVVESEVFWETPLFPDGYSIILRSALFNTATTTI